MSFIRNNDFKISRAWIPFSRLKSRLLKLQSPFRDWDWDFQNVNRFFETGIETDKFEGITVIKTGIETFNIKWYNWVFQEILISKCSELWSFLRDWNQDFSNFNPFLRLGSRPLKCQSLLREWDQDFQNYNPFFETGIKTRARA